MKRAPQSFQNIIFLMTTSDDHFRRRGFYAKGRVIEEYHLRSLFEKALLCEKRRHLKENLKAGYSVLRIL